MKHLKMRFCGRRYPIKAESPGLLVDMDYSGIAYEFHMNVHLDKHGSLRHKEHESAAAKAMVLVRKV